jgi:hypothetical protein
MIPLCLVINIPAFTVGNRWKGALGGWMELGHSGQKEEMADGMFLKNDCFAKYTIS